MIIQERIRENGTRNGRILERLGRTRTMAPELPDFSFLITVSQVTCDISTLGCFCFVMDQRNALKVLNLSLQRINFLLKVVDGT